MKKFSNQLDCVSVRWWLGISNPERTLNENTLLTTFITTTNLLFLCVYLLSLRMRMSGNGKALLGAGIPQKHSPLSFCRLFVVVLVRGGIFQAAAVVLDFVPSSSPRLSFDNAKYPEWSGPAPAFQFGSVEQPHTLPIPLLDWQAGCGFRWNVTGTAQESMDGRMDV